ncbi:MAG: hypothetical protein U9N58_00960 [Thermodesulfobacteriota bacterium]|nr:hypothetical protein [Thermodesulfobacteriota bacterium]
MSRRSKKCGLCGFQNPQLVVVQHLPDYLSYVVHKERFHDEGSNAYGLGLLFCQAVKVILSDLLKRHRKLYSLIPKTRLRLRHTRLVYLPFKLQGREFVDLYSGQAIPANAIELGKSI